MFCDGCANRASEGRTSIVAQPCILACLGGHKWQWQPGVGADRRGMTRGRTVRRLRLVDRHRLRMVRFLSLRDAGAVLRGAVLPARQRHGGAAFGLRDLRRRLPGAPVRRHLLRPHRRSRRPQIHLPRHHHGHGHLDLRGRPAADLRDASAGSRRSCSSLLAPAAGPGARRRIWRCRDLCGRARAMPATAAMRRQLDPDHGDARLLPVADRHPASAATR